jgi:hypothetical protein
MTNRIYPFLATISAVGTLLALSCSTEAQPSLLFEKRFVAAEAFESVAVLDVDGDGTLDLLSGSFWYKGPDFVSRKFIGAISRHSEYYDDFSAIVLDVNGDKQLDVVTGGWFGATLVWRENPGKAGDWEQHVIGRPGNVESTRAWDIDGDGITEIVPNTPGKPLRIYRLDHTQKTYFDSVQILGSHGHGLGFGDINGDGRGDFVVDNGWVEAPANPFTEKWKLHEEFKFQQASVPMIVADVNGDKLNDIIIGQGHDYGLHWLEQVRGKDAASRTWKRHEIDPNNSQYHTMEWTDLDGDGRPELITGKRYRAHDDNDPGAHDPLGLYYFRWNGEAFIKQVISYGKPGEGKGTGLYFQVVDLAKDGKTDIAVAGTEGLYVFFNKGPAK